MQTDLGRDQVCEPRSAIAHRYVSWSRLPSDGIPNAGPFGSRNASAERLMGRADMSGSGLPAAYIRRPPFDRLTICLHWVTALVVLALFTIAVLRSQLAEDDTRKAVLLQVHRSLGVTIWAVTALRLAWRLTKAKLPPFAENMTKMHRAIVPLSEHGLYALLLDQPVTGLSATIFAGRPFALFLWQIPQLVPGIDGLRAAFHLAHELGAWVLGVSAAAHAAYALIHHLVFRDDVLRCMAPGIPRPQHINQ
jgi:cytochrome b561